MRAVLGSLIRGRGWDTANGGKRDVRPFVAACEGTGEEDGDDETRKNIYWASPGNFLAYTVF